MIQNKIEQLLAPLIEELGYELWGCVLIQGKAPILRIYIAQLPGSEQRQDTGNLTMQAGITLEDCELVSRQVAALLDVEDPIPGHYSLEVSSPGIPRPLLKAEQYQRYLQHEVAIKLVELINERRNLQGKIIAVNDEILTLALGGQLVEIPFSKILKANLVGE